MHVNNSKHFFEQYSLAYILAYLNVNIFGSLETILDSMFKPSFCSNDEMIIKSDLYFFDIVHYEIRQNENKLFKIEQLDKLYLLNASALC